MKKQNLEFVGKPLSRVDAMEKVLGRAQFIDDMEFAGLLTVRVVPSPYPHALIKSVDTREAALVQGVRAVLTWKDIPGKNQVGCVVEDQPLLVEKRARYLGDPIALVVAESEEACDRAAKLVKIEAEKLPGVFGPLEGIRRDAPKIHDNGNIACHLRIRNGDVDEAFRKSDVVIEDSFEVKHQEHMYLEPQGIVAVPEKDGAITVYGSMQCPFYVQAAVARILGQPLSKVRVIQAYTGGGFGGKEDIPSEVAGLAALAAVRTGRPCKLKYTREEDMLMTSKRHAMILEYRVGAMKDGSLTAIEARIYADCGAYSTLTPVVLFRTTVHVPGPYRVPCVKADVYGVYTNHVRSGAFRGFGTPQVIFAIESMMDKLAFKLEMDPVELRLKNALEKGDFTGTRQKLEDSVGLKETIRKAADMCNWSKRLRDIQKFNASSKVLKRGLGMATCYYGMSLGSKGWFLDQAYAHVVIRRDGSVNIGIGNTEMGQGALTVITQIAAETLLVKPERIRISHVDTALVPDSGPTVASRTTAFSGNAVKDAAEGLRQTLLEAAARFLDVKKDELVAGIEVFSSKNDATKKAGYQELVEWCFVNNIPLARMGSWTSPPIKWDTETGLGDAYYVYSYATHVAQVLVDMETGSTTVEEVWAAHDVGQVVNPVLAEGQVEGGFTQGMGWATIENFVMKEGKVESQNFSTYIVPTSLDAPPKIHTAFTSVPSKDGPYGVKGLGEPSLMPSAAACANAIRNATGRNIRKLPVLPEYILFEAEPEMKESER